MKKYLTIATMLCVASSAFATERGTIEQELIASQEQRSGSCQEIYNRVSTVKFERNRSISKMMAPIYYTSAGGFMFAFAIGQAVPGLAFWTVGAIAGTVGLIYQESTPNEEKVILMTQEQSKQFDRLLKKARKIRSNITEQDIADIVVQGMESGKFCEDFPKLYSPRQVRNYVLEQVASR